MVEHPQHLNVNIIAFQNPFFSYTVSTSVPVTKNLQSNKVVSVHFSKKSQISVKKDYLPMYNARPCIIRTTILDCTLKKKTKKKGKQRTEEVVTEK